jgi:hypothetical protein
MPGRRAKVELRYLVKNPGFLKETLRCIIEAFFAIGVEDSFGLMAKGRAERWDRLVTGSPWSKAIAVGGTMRFPSGFERVLDHGLACSMRHCGDAQGPFVRRARFRYPGVSDWAGRPVEGERLG